MANMEATAGTREVEARTYKPEWAGLDVRLDPYRFPQQISYERARLDQRGASDVNITLNHQGAVMKRELECGLPVSLSLPAASFEGIAAHAFENEDGTTTITLEMRHADPELTVPLCVSTELEETACDWHSWSRALGLPMLMIDEAGVAHVVKNVGVETDTSPKPRRRRVTSLKSRPNFLRRRKAGVVGPVRVLEAHEIIART